MTSSVEENLKPSRRREWLGFLALVAVALCAYFASSYLGRLRPASAPPADKERFLALHLPEMSSNPTVTSAGKKRLEEWLTALESAGYHPVPFSQALASLSGKAGLPEKAVVLVYDPGFRSTYDGLSPILARHRAPAALITDAAGVAASDVRFPSKHALDVMKRSGLWEVGFFRGSTMTFTLGEDSFSWGPEVGRYVLNRKENLGALNRLNVNLTWTGPQLLEIIRAMAPTEVSCLTTGLLLGQPVGIVKPATTCGASDAFALEAAPDAHSASMFWRGASSVKDFSLILEADSVVDELMLYLRYDARKRQGLQLTFSPKRVEVLELKGGRKKRIAAQEWSYPGGQFISSLTLNGDRLDLAMGNGRLQSIALPAAEGAPGSNIMLIVYSKLRGVAQAKSLHLILTPL